jgi:hypothetical protein
VLRAAFAGAGAAETFDPFEMSTPAEFARSRVVFEELFRLRDGAPVGWLATGADVAPDGSGFVLRLREGVLPGPDPAGALVARLRDKVPGEPVEQNAG